MESISYERECNNDDVGDDNWSSDSLDEIMYPPDEGQDLCDIVPEDQDIYDSVHEYSSPQTPLIYELHPATRSLPFSFTAKQSELSGSNATSFYNSLTSLKSYPWFHGYMTVKNAENLLKGTHTGTFLVRESLSRPGQHSISLHCDGHTVHYCIMNDIVKSKIFIIKNIVFSSLPELVSHHSRHSDGLKASLKHPCPRIDMLKHHPAEPSPICEPSAEGDEWELSRSDIHISSKIGGGQYGDVYKANYSGEPVAVKVLKVSK